MSPNPLGIHALVFAGGTDADDIAIAVAGAVTAGYDILELSLHDAESLDAPSARRAIEDAGLGVVTSRGLAHDADVSSEDPALVARGEELLQRSLDITAQLGGRLLTGALYSAFGNPGRQLTRRGRSNAVAVLRNLAIEAASRDVVLGLEVCNRYETNVVNTAADALALADDIGADNVVIHLDSYHMNIEEDDLTRPIRLVGDRLGYVHVGENHRGYLGSGHLDLPQLAHSLADVGYTGPLTFESFSSAVASPTLSNQLAIWRNLWDDGPALAAHAHGYLSALLEAARAA